MYRGSTFLQTMENGTNNNGNQFQIEIPQDLAGGIYSNLAIITHSSSEFIIDFASLLPGVPKPTVRSRIIMNPEHAKRLLGALQENIVKYEKEFGKINFPSNSPRTIAPFGPVKGDA